MFDNLYTESNKTTAIRSWIMWQMLRGMGWAALFVFAIGVTLGVIWGIGQMLPAASKEAPSPYTSLEVSRPPNDLA